MSNHLSIATRATSLATGAVVAAMTASMERTGSLPAHGDWPTRRLALRLLEEHTDADADAEALGLARELIERHLAG